MEHLVSFLREANPDQVQYFAQRLKFGDDVGALLASLTASSSDDGMLLHHGGTDSRVSPESITGDDHFTSPTITHFPESSRNNQACYVPSGAYQSKAFAVPTSPYFSTGAGPNRRKDAADYPRYCDDRLQFLMIHYWTTTAITNNCAAAIISLYLENDHPILGLFDADLFVADLTARREEFCSPILVVSLLFYASQAFTSIDGSVASLTPLLLEEAQDLWETESKRDSMLTACAAQILSLGCSSYGQNGFGTTCLRKGVAMAERLGLLGSETNQSLMQSSKTTRAAAHIAWGIFNWLTLRSIQHQEDVVKHSPNLPIPGQRSSTGFEIEFADPPAYMGKTFTALCNFWLLVNGIALLYYPRKTRSPRDVRPSFAFADWVYQRVEQWAEDNAFIWRQDAIVPHHVKMLEIYRHSVIIDIYRPFQAPGHDMDKTATSKAKKICAFSLEELKRHVCEYPSLYPSARYSMIWHTAPYYVVNAVLASPTTQADLANSRMYFRLCANAYVHLSRSFPVALDILDGILAMGIKRNVISVSEARGFHFQAQQNGGRPETGGDSSMTFKLDLELSMTDPEKARLSTLTDELHTKLMFHDYTMGNYETMDETVEETGYGFSA